MIPRKPKKFLHEEVYNCQVKCKGDPYCGQFFGVDVADLDEIKEIECECGSGVELLGHGKVTRLIENPDYAVWKMWRDAFDRTKYKQ